MPKCDSCARERTQSDGTYSPVQAVTGGPFGWYSDEDTELCPEHFTELFLRGNGIS